MRNGVLGGMIRAPGVRCHYNDMNLALPKSRVAEALRRLETYVF